MAAGRGVDAEVGAAEELAVNMARLTPQQFDVVRLSCQEGLEDGKIAAKLRTSVQVVRVARSQARARLEGR